jgi:type II secretory pathway pseudopilin PulG
MVLRSSRKRQALSLLEILVVTGIIAILVALLLVSIVKARDAAKRLECVNNLYQLGLAFRHHHDTQQAFPTEDGSNPSFYRTLLPYIEQNYADDTTPIRTYLCPSRRGVDVGPRRDYGYAASNANGSRGLSILDSPSPGVSLDVIMSYNKGAANTSLLTHLWMSPSNYLSGSDPTDVGWASENNSRIYASVGRADNDPNGSTDYLGGPHPQGMPTLFSDGHVGTVSYSAYEWADYWAYRLDDSQLGAAQGRWIRVWHEGATTTTPTGSTGTSGSTGGTTTSTTGTTSSTTGSSGSSLTSTINSTDYGTQTSYQTTTTTYSQTVPTIGQNTTTSSRQSAYQTPATPYPRQDTMTSLLKNLANQANQYAQMANQEAQQSMTDAQLITNNQQYYIDLANEALKYAQEATQYAKDTNTYAQQMDINNTQKYFQLTLDAYNKVHERYVGVGVGLGNQRELIRLNSEAKQYAQMAMNEANKAMSDANTITGANASAAKQAANNAMKYANQAQNYATLVDQYASKQDLSNTQNYHSKTVNAYYTENSYYNQVQEYLATQYATTTTTSSTTTGTTGSTTTTTTTTSTTGSTTGTSSGSTSTGSTGTTGSTGSTSGTTTTTSTSGSTGGSTGTSGSGSTTSTTSGWWEWIWVPW